MKHFAYYPRISYNTESAVNILVRGKIRDAVLNVTSLYYKYYVRDNDSAEMISEKYYGRSEYVWAIYYANNILHPTFDWPMPENIFFKFLQSKYGSVENAIDVTHHYELLDRETNEMYIIDESTYRNENATKDALLKEGKEYPNELKAVSAYDYELSENNRKRNIVVLDQRHLFQITNELKVLFK